MTVTMKGADATLAGAVHLGYFNVGSMFTDDAEETIITPNQMIERATKQVNLKSSKGVFQLSNALVNHDIAMKMNMSVSHISDDNSFGNEWVCYAVIEKPFSNLTGTDKLNYTMDLEIHSNYVANPKV